MVVAFCNFDEERDESLKRQTITLFGKKNVVKVMLDSINLSSSSNSS